MKQHDLWNTSFSQLRAFIVTADYESITKASSALMMTQSALSKNIKALEDELGLVLFVRSAGKLRLSPAGRVFRDEAEGVLAAAEQAVERAHAAQAVVSRRIILAIPDSMSFGATLGRMIGDYADARKTFSFGVEYCGFSAIPKLIASRRVDLGITPLFDEQLYKPDSFASAVLETFPLAAFMRPENPLSQKESLSIGDLGGVPLVGLSEAVSPLYEQNVIAPLGIMGGFKPRLVHLAFSPRSVAASVSSDLEVFVADKYYAVDGFVCREIAETQSGIMLVWNAEADSLVNDLADYIIENWR